MPKFSIGDEVITNDRYDDTDHPMWGTVVTVGEEDHDFPTYITIRVAADCHAEYHDGWQKYGDYYSYYWYVTDDELKLVKPKGPPTTTREMSRKLMREAGYA